VDESSERYLEQALRDADELIDDGDLDSAFRLLKRLFDELTVSEELLRLASPVARLLKEEERLYGRFNPDHARAFRFSPDQSRRLAVERCGGARADAFQFLLVIAATALGIVYLIVRALT
jgi:hypothetical protein